MYKVTIVQPGISSYTFPWSVGIEEYGEIKPFTVFSLLQRAIEYDVTAIQFGDNLPLHKLMPLTLERLKEESDSTGIEIEVGTRGLTKENILRYLAIANKLGAGLIRMVIDDKDKYPNEAEVIGIIGSVIPELEKSNVMLAIENHDRFPAKSLKMIIEQTDKHLIGICLDTANSLGAGEGIHEVLDILAPYTVNLHVKDFMIERVDHKMGFRVQGRPAGEGQLDIPGIIMQLEREGRCRTATLELWLEPEESIGATLAKETEWAERSISYLKEILK